MQNATNSQQSNVTRMTRYAPWLILIGGLGLALSLVIATSLIGAYYYVAPSLPQAENIREIPLQIPLRIFSRDGRLIEEVGERRRILVDYEDLPPYVVQAFISVESSVVTTSKPAAYVASP